MGILSNSKSNAAEVDVTDMALLDAVDPEPGTKENVVKSPVLKSAVQPIAVDEKTAIDANAVGNTKASTPAKVATSETTQNNGAQKVDQALASAQKAMIKKVQEIIGDAGEAGKKASLFEMASKLIDAIIRMIEMLLQRLGLAQKQRKSEGDQNNRDQKSSDQQASIKQGVVPAKPTEIQAQRNSAQQGDTPEPTVETAEKQEAESETTEPIAQTTVVSPEISEVDRRLAQAEALINSITGKVGEMLGNFLSDPFVQVHAERGDKSATISALCDRALEVCRQDISSVSALVRELTADISGPDAQRFGMRPREVAQLILDGGLDPSLVNPKLKSKATLLLREYGPLSDRLSTIRQAVGIIVADTVSQAVSEGESSSAVLNETLLSLKSKLITLGGGDDQAMTRLGLDESFKDIGVSIQSQTDSSVQQPAETVLESPLNTPAELQQAEIAIQPTAPSASPENTAMVSESTGEATHDENAASIYLQAANDGEYLEPEVDGKSDLDRPRA